MNRNNFITHLALAIVIILIAAFAGQLRTWQKEARSVVQIIPAESKRVAFYSDSDTALARPELLVRFKPGVSLAAKERITAEFNDRIEDRIGSVPGLVSIDDLDDLDPEATAAAYRKLPDVEYAEPNYELSLDHAGGGFKHRHPDDPRFMQQWGLANDGTNGGKEGADISAMRAWATSIGDQKVIVAVLDSGVDYTHEDLRNNMWVRPADLGPYQDRELGVIDDVHGFNAVENSGDPMDDNGHGTHCAGIIGAEGGNGIGVAGVNWKVEIMPLKFMNAGGFGTTKDAIEAINYVIKRKRDGVNVRVISASWGSRMRSRALEDVIRSAQEAGILFVAASGNASVDNDRAPHYPASFKLDNVISVAALTKTDELAAFSNYGPRSVHVAAPGVGILSTWLGQDYEEKSGTSMATPFVAGVAALVIANNPDIKLPELRSVLLRSVDPVPALAGRIASGGRINAARALAGE